MMYVVSMVGTHGRTKIKIMEADNIHSATKMAQENYPSYEITRVSNNTHDIDYYYAMKKSRKETT